MVTLHSERHGDVHLGKLDPQPLENSISYTELRKPLVAAGVLPKRPAKWGHASAFANGPVSRGGWGMLGNGPCDDGSIPEGWAAYDGAGNCAIAGPCHEHMMDAKITSRAVPAFTCRSALEQYSAFLKSIGQTPYDLQTGDGDTGCAVAQVIAWRQKTGLTDANGGVHKIGQAIELTPGNLDELWEAAYLFDCAGIGIQVQEALMRLADEGKPWDWVKGSPIEGGHYIFVPSLRKLISWGDADAFTNRFYEKANDETVCYVAADKYEAVTGDSVEGYDSQDLEKYLRLVAQLKLAA